MTRTINQQLTAAIIGGRENRVMEKTPPMKLPLRRTVKRPGDHIMMNPALREWMESRHAR